MLAIQRKQQIAFVILILSLGLTSFFGLRATTLYTAGIQNVKAAQTEIHSEVLQITANDGTPLKALYFVNPEVMNNQNHSVPLLICAHGMSDDYFIFMDFYYTMTQAGWAILAPEFRGHTSNPAPCTLGYLEPYDILQWMDYLEINFNNINISATGIYGHSMGGLYAVLTYIIESQGEGRIKAVAEAAGPINLTREIDFLSNNIDPLGTMAFNSHIDEKNPINYANSTFPKNLIMFHGDQDTIVSYQCAEDFFRIIDPNNTRNDVEYYRLHNQNHNIHITGYVLTRVKAWMDKFILNINTNPDDVVLLQNPIDEIETTEQGIRYILFASISSIFIIPMILYLVKPLWFYKKHEKELIFGNLNYKEHVNQIKIDEKSLNIESPPFEKISPPQEVAIFKINPKNEARRALKEKKKYQRKYNLPIISDIPSPYEPKISGKSQLHFYEAYFLTMIITGLIAYAIQTFIVSEIFLATIGTTILLLILYRHIKEPETKILIKKNIDDMLNPRSGLIWIGSIALSITLYVIITSLDILEKQSLVPGVRRTWWIPFMTIIFTVQLVVNVIFIRNTRAKPIRGIKEWRGEAPVMGALYGFGMILFFEAFLNATYMFTAKVNFDINLIFILILVFGGLFILFDLIMQIGEYFTKSVLPGAFACSLTLFMFWGGSKFIFFY